MTDEQADLVRKGWRWVREFIADLELDHREAAAITALSVHEAEEREAVERHAPDWDALLSRRRGPL